MKFAVSLISFALLGNLILSQGAESETVMSTKAVSMTTNETDRALKAAVSPLKNGIEEHDGVITVTINILPEAEGIKRRLVDGTALLRTRAYLVKMFPKLRRHVNVKTRVIKRGYDDDERIFTYETEYQRDDIVKAIEAEERYRATQEKFAAQKKAEEEARILAEEEAIAEGEEAAMAKAEVEAKRREQEELQKKALIKKQQERKKLERAQISREVEHARKKQVVALKEAVNEAENDNELEGGIALDANSGLSSGANDSGGGGESVDISDVFK